MGVVPEKSTTALCSYSALGHADYIGCFVENGMFPYTYGDRHFESLTIDFCLLGCADDGFKYAGMMSRQWCQCDNDLYSDTTGSKVSDSECDTPCYGNGSQMWGGDFMLSIYRISKV
ncbi:kremen protein 2-like [Mytilus trossulus]|uniref:kremen protein 2-like n=1 Tax=Mytilus trossulus TaxID=6551 RepID=UPI0030070FF8